MPGLLHQEGLTPSIHHVTCDLQSRMGAAGALPGPPSLRTTVTSSAKLMPRIGHHPLPRPFPDPSSPALCHAPYPQLSAVTPASEFTLQGERELGQGPVSSLLHPSVPSSPPISLTAPTRVSSTLSTSLWDHSPHPHQLWPRLCPTRTPGLCDGQEVSLVLPRQQAQTGRTAGLPLQSPPRAYSLSLSL